MTTATLTRARRSRGVVAIGVVGFAIALALASQIAVPIAGTPVPITLQPLVVVLAGLWLGPAAGAASMVLYLAAGAAGLPVFSPFGAPGIARFVGPTGGYLLAYPVAAFVAGALGRRAPSLLGRWVAALAGTAVLLLGGLAQLVVITGSVSQAATLGLHPFVPLDAVKALLAALLAQIELSRAGLTARVFFRNSAGALRPPWRLAIFAASTAISLVVVNGAVVPLASWVFALAGIRVVLFPWALLVVALLAHVLTFRWAEPRGWRSVSFDASALEPRAIGLGALLGAASVAIPVLALLALGWLRVEPAAPGSSLGAALTIGVFLAPAALWEELMFRGYAFAVLASWLGTAAALGITSAAFGLIHFANAGASPATVAVVVLAGVMLGGVLVVTRSLYAAFAAHFAWNWMLAGVFHSAVSGVPFATPDYRMVDAGPDWATGGVWGPEGGAGAALGLAAATSYLYARRGRRGGR